MDDDPRLHEGTWTFMANARLLDRRLTPTVHGSLLRAVLVHKVLRGFGRAFKSNEGNQEDYLQSFPAEYLHDFISHTWSTSRWAKVATLCLIYNGRAAMVVSTGFGLLLGLLQCTMAGAEPPGTPVFSQLLCPWVFGAVFFYWQEIRKRLGYSVRRVFVDKFCIDQLDQDSKAQGILSFPAFLKYTERLVVCWSPDYLRRLWCVFELASWLHLDKPFNSVLFFPVSRGSLVVAHGCALYVALLVYLVTSRLTFRYQEIIFLIALAFSFPAARFLQHSIQDVMHLPEQIETFSIGTAGCFCCSTSHVVFGTGESLLCDRELVQETVESWYQEDFLCSIFEEAERLSSNRSDGSPTSPLERSAHSSQSPMKTRSSHSSPSFLPDSSSWRRKVCGSTGVEKFDSIVRDIFGPFILHTSRPEELAYEHVLLCVMPLCWRLCDLAAELGTATGALRVAHASELFVVTFAVWPCWLRLVCYCFIRLDKCVCVPEGGYLQCLFSGVAGLAMELLAMCLWLPLRITAHSDSAEGWVLFAATSASYFALTAAIYARAGADREEAHQSRVSLSSWRGTDRLQAA